MDPLLIPQVLSAAHNTSQWISFQMKNKNLMPLKLENCHLNNNNTSYIIYNMYDYYYYYTQEYLGKQLNRRLLLWNNSVKNIG